MSGQPDGGLQISVKRVSADGRPGAPSDDPAGEVSGYLHAHVHGGETLRVSPPFGEVVLCDDGEGPLLFASAGIGCTPMVAMLSHLAATGSRRRVIAAHADRSPATHPFRTDLHRLTGKLADATAELWYEEEFDPRKGSGTNCLTVQGKRSRRRAPMRWIRSPCARGSWI